LLMFVLLLSSTLIATLGAPGKPRFADLRRLVDSATRSIQIAGCMCIAAASAVRRSCMIMGPHASKTLSASLVRTVRCMITGVRLFLSESTECASITLCLLLYLELGLARICWSRREGVCCM
jgi:hypothetical protein